MHRFFAVRVDGDHAVLPPDEAQHALRVLPLRGTCFWHWYLNQYFPRSRSGVEPVSVVCVLDEHVVEVAEKVVR